MGVVYTASQLAGNSLPEINFTLPGGSLGLLVSNNSVWDLTVFSPLWSMTVPSYSNATMPSTGNLQTTVKGLSKDSDLIALSNASVSWGSSQVAVPLNITPIASKAVVPISITGGSITATIDTSGGPVDISGSTAVTNTQVGVGLNFSGLGTVTVPANTTGQVNGSTIQLVPAGQSLSSSTLEVWVNSAINSDLTRVNLQLNMVFADGTVATVANPTTSTLNPVTSGPAFINLSAQDSITANTQGVPIQFNQVVVGVNMGTANSGDQTVSIRFVFSGLAVPDITSQNNPAMVSPSFQVPGTTGQTSMFNGVPLPVQPSRYVSGVGYVLSGPTFINASNITRAAGANYTVNSSPTITIDGTFAVEVTNTGSASANLAIGCFNGGSWTEFISVQSLAAGATAYLTVQITNYPEAGTVWIPSGGKNHMTVPPAKSYLVTVLGQAFTINNIVGVLVNA